MNQIVAGDADFRQLIIDSTVARAHPCAAGAFVDSRVNTTKKFTKSVACSNVASTR